MVDQSVELFMIGSKRISFALSLSKGGGLRQSLS